MLKSCGLIFMRAPHAEIAKAHLLGCLTNLLFLQSTMELSRLLLDSALQFSTLQLQNKETEILVPWVKCYCS
jgi:hypothetical protein